ncbi:hypothetical protein [Aquimarina litoralis]|uniref:hypothetical protein n=1 Tax=Aquimarina litoralis TaxID=584605 RepID=UPI001C56194D|nr:hypothetical protein [Aquimarina litoralis]MBW1298279.1 hypothetical protein [Aquimarina litoralis]
MNGFRSIPAIEKEDIKFLRFPNQEVLQNKKDKNCRSINVKRAMRLGNLEHGKVKIIFADDQGTKKVETTIWGVTEKSVILKQSTVIPLRRIISVN